MDSSLLNPGPVRLGLLICRKHSRGAPARDRPIPSIICRDIKCFSHKTFSLTCDIISVLDDDVCYLIFLLARRCPATLGCLALAVLPARADGPAAPDAATNTAVTLRPIVVTANLDAAR